MAALLWMSSSSTLAMSSESSALPEMLLSIGYLLFQSQDWLNIIVANEFWLTCRCLVCSFSKSWRIHNLVKVIEPTRMKASMVKEEASWPWNFEKRGIQLIRESQKWDEEAEDFSSVSGLRASWTIRLSKGRNTNIRKS